MKVRIAGAAWLAGVAQFFVVHGIVQSAWERPYSWARNNISDLGNARCALQPDPTPRYVCSPEHGLMNGSFVVLGALLVVGAVLSGPLWRRGATARVARVLLAGAGAGFVLAGLAPADTSENQHVLGALLIMGTGNIGLLAAGSGLAPEAPALLRRAGGLLGVVALGAWGLFLSGNYLGMGMGGMERVAVFPLLVWASVVGAYGLVGPAVTRCGPLPAPR
ncbi:DUF998 domain-containing protein [Streptomyces rubradiris]|uniref:DUF998 domain-containing protein n=1 Tax=Streptomyces rubradiris TaxID=285531 RepID=A0ABQ3RJT8_STRRR|nr:DUF998 domain-containing protein [Streptomyces rubradiris]GHH08988.1 hypothetical protein GCM10018792_31460 [Streptomyces rubradiris]GHI56116.1 hypothetical protein Srubr_59620 [Streptomyces rubradiris]